MSSIQSAQTLLDHMRKLVGQQSAASRRVGQVLAGREYDVVSYSEGIGADRSIYSFVLLAPPVPLERLEGAFAEQAKILGEELATLQERLGGRGIEPAKAEVSHGGVS